MEWDKKRFTTFYMKLEQFSARSKGHFLFAMALDFYKLNKK